MSGFGYQLRGPASGAPSGCAFGPVFLPPGRARVSAPSVRKFTTGSAPDRQTRPGLLWHASKRFQGESEAVCSLVPGGAPTKHRGALRPASSRGATARSMPAAAGPSVSGHRQGITDTTSRSTGPARIRSPDGSAENPSSRRLIGPCGRRRDSSRMTTNANAGFARVGQAPEATVS
jgi:hypothetical protein